jgi:Mlc titration factor MtfA (ptsG expression regulator)
MFLNQIFCILQKPEDQHPTFVLVVFILTVLIFGSFIVIFLRYVFSLVEGVYVDIIDKKPLFRHLYLRLNKLDNHQVNILKQDFFFYKKLPKKEKKYFEHRVSKFIKSNDFIAKENIVITEQMKILIASTAVMLTFGYRDYNIELLDKVLLYPDVFFSNTNKDYHKGEFNIGYRAIVFSWNHFKEGYDIKNDNLNLGIHEFIHAIHFSYLTLQNKNNISAAIFLTAFEELTTFLDADYNYKQKLITSKYIREYAYTNQFEFIAVLIENFIETPNEFRNQFPEVYNKIKQMLNFNFAGY